MITVGGSPTSKHFNLAIDINRERYLHHALAHLQSIPNALFQLHDVDSVIHHVLDAFTKRHTLLGELSITHKWRSIAALFLSVLLSELFRE